MRGRPGIFADAWYQQGWREGRKRSESEQQFGRCQAARSLDDRMTQCPQVARFEAAAVNGSRLLVCGIHARLAERYGHHTQKRDDA